MIIGMLHNNSRRLKAHRAVALNLPILCALSLVFAFDAKQSSAQRRREVKVPQAIVQQLFKDDELKDALEYKHEYTIEGLSKRLVAELIDLNGDGKLELSVHGINDICGAANCASWIYHKTTNGYQLLLDAGSIQNVKPQRTFTNGYRDIITSMHGSAFDSDLSLYTFDGKMYRLKACFYRHYRNYNDKRGRLHVSKHPLVTRAKCEPEQ